MELMTLGPGYGPTWPTDYKPSFRVWGQGGIYSIANALGGSYPTAAAVSAAATAPASAPQASTKETVDNGQSTGTPVAADENGEAGASDIGGATSNRLSAGVMTLSAPAQTSDLKLPGDGKTSQSSDSAGDSPTVRAGGNTKGKGHGARSARSDRGAA
jgi:hypothetical protein